MMIVCIALVAWLVVVAAVPKCINSLHGSVSEKWEVVASGAGLAAGQISTPACCIHECNSQRPGGVVDPCLLDVHFGCVKNRDECVFQDDGYAYIYASVSSSDSCTKITFSKRLARP